MKFPRFVCPDCGLPFALPAYFVEQARADGREVYCPNGHVSELTRRDRPDTIRRRLEVKDRYIAHLEEKVAWMEEKLAQR
jgi:hypothetical protein